MVLWKEKLLNFFIPGTWQRINRETADSVTVLYIKDRFARAMSYRPLFLASNTVRPITTCCVIRALSISPHCEIFFRSSNIRLDVTSQIIIIQTKRRRVLVKLSQSAVFFPTKHQIFHVAELKLTCTDAYTLLRGKTTVFSGGWGG